MINKLLVLFKIGSPKINLQLQNYELKPGECVSGSFLLQGGWVKQKIKRLECDLVRECTGQKPEVIEPVKTLLMSQTIELNERTEIPFSYTLPKALTPTSDNVSYRLLTKLVFTDDKKSIDHDEIVVK
ncbi:sporulation protein [Aquibacillus salsiterrae]|uniref:Sporulation protein n=1 Tax=Aquibacillus salsiterrae TaxID=2950439 RepID=A0A9X3WGS5_9BACI|nr:sporulation protein [Aquibacillus salsiterrae]MDC3417154.1 sporulation protein [Aquibacillus salsiterrae]